MSHASGNGQKQRHLRYVRPRLMRLAGMVRMFDAHLCVGKLPRELNEEDLCVVAMVSTAPQQLFVAAGIPLMQQPERAHLLGNGKTWATATAHAEEETDRLVMDGFAGQRLKVWAIPGWYWSLRPMRRLR